MMIEHEYKMLIIFLLIIIAMVVATIAIPVYGYRHKRYKGLAIGCLAQPFAIIILIILAELGSNFYVKWKIDRKKADAMVTIRSTETFADHVDTLMWYIKNDGECVLDKEEKEDKRNMDLSYPVSLFDVIRLNDASVGVEDRVMVKFDLKSKKVMATDLYTPAEVVNVDWDKVNAYFEKKE